LGFFYHTSSAGNNNLLRFNLPILSSSRSAYVLYDCGASHKFVRSSFISQLKQENQDVKTRKKGFMKITTANSEERIARYESWLTVDMGGYVYSRWFVHYNLLQYEIILGKDWMVTTRHWVDHQNNILYLGYKGNTWRYSIAGLPLGVGRVESFRDRSHKGALTVSEYSKSILLETMLGSLSPELAGLVRRFKEVFVEPEGLPPDHRPPGFRIRLKPGSEPPHRSPYRLTIKEKETYHETIQQLISKRHIRPSSSPYAAPVMFVPKAGTPGELHRVIDYRELNRQTVKDRYPFPHGEELIDRLQGAKVFSKLDFWSGFHQHRMASQDVEKTAFIGPDSLYEWLVMPFGLSNAPSEFMRVMSNLLREHIKAGYCVVFIGDILVYSKDTLHHSQHLEKVLHTIQKAGYRLKPDKCSFGSIAAEFLGFAVDGEGVQMLLDKVESICAWPIPQTPKQMRSFVGLAGVYRKFIPHFASVTLPLLALIPRTNAEYNLKLSNPDTYDQVAESISIIKKTISSAPALALPEKGNTEFLICTDASGFAIGATLRQMQWNPESESFPKERILGYYSRKLSGAETRYSTYDQELLAVRDAIEHWRYYLHGSHFTVQTDHSSLQHVLKQPKLSSRQMRLLERLQQYNFEIEYLPGVQNYIQDALSRWPDYQKTQVHMQPSAIQPVTRVGRDTIPICIDLDSAVQTPVPNTTATSVGDIFTTITVTADGWLDELWEGYSQDPYFAKVLIGLGYENSRNNYTREGQGEQENSTKNTLSLQRGKAWQRHYTLLPDRLITHNKSGSLCIPNAGRLRQRVMAEAHDTPIGGHFGVERTASALARRFFGPECTKR